MEDWQKRVVSEKEDLTTKIEALQNSEHIQGDKLLQEQLGVMKKYEAVLIQRISLF